MRNTFFHFLCNYCELVCNFLKFQQQQQQKNLYFFNTFFFLYEMSLFSLPSLFTALKILHNFQVLKFCAKCEKYFSFIICTKCCPQQFEMHFKNFMTKALMKKKDTKDHLSQAWPHFLMKYFFRRAMQFWRPNDLHLLCA